MNQETYTHLFQEELYQAPQIVVVVLAKAWDDYTPEDKALLSKILGSVKLSMASVQLVVQPTLSLPSLASCNPSEVLVFGSASDEIKLYEVTPAQGFSVIKADDLSQLDDAKKKSLWQALRSMFALN